MSKKFLIFILFIIPFITQLFMLPLVNKSQPVILGLPLLEFWFFLWILLTPICSLIIHQLQKK
jgi:hypothetical protein